MGRIITLAIILSLAALGINSLQVAAALSTVPSVPEFTVKYVDHSYDTLPTYEVDQYTGKTVIAKPSEHVDNRTVEITIKNQAFTTFTDDGGYEINLFYDVRYKGSFGQEWISMFGERSEWAGVYDPYGKYGYPTQDSSSQYTTIIYQLAWHTVDGQMDIQVQALKGYTNRTADPSRAHIIWTVYIYTFHGQASGWSNTQTVKLGSNSETASSAPTLPPLQPTPSVAASTYPATNATDASTQPNTLFEAELGFDWKDAAIAVMAVVIAALAFGMAKTRRKLSHN